MSIGKLAGELVKEFVYKFTPIPFLPTVIDYIISEITRQEEKLPQVNEELKRVLEQQEEILYRFDHKLNLLIMNPIKQGKRYLIEAQDQENKGDFEMFVQEAQWKFFDASDTELPEFPTLPIEAVFFSGVCYYLLGKNDNALRKYNETFEAINKNSEYKWVFRSQLTQYLKAAQIPKKMKAWIEPALENDIRDLTKTSIWRPSLIRKYLEQQGDENARIWLGNTLRTNRTLLNVKRTNQGQNPRPLFVANEKVMVPKSSLPYHVRQDLADLGKYLAWIIHSRSKFNKPVTENVMGYAILEQLETSSKKKKKKKK